MTRAITARRAATRGGVVLASMVVVIVLTSAFGLAGHVVSADRAIVGGLHELAVAEVTHVMEEISDLGGMDVVPWLCALGVLALCWWRHWAGAGALLASVAVTQGVVALVKGVVERPRPAGSDALVHAAGYGFPSGHAATAAALYGALVLIALDRLSGRTRTVVVGAALAAALAIGLTRVYLGAHHPTDVLAGWLLGAVIAGCSWWVARCLCTSAALWWRQAQA